MRGKNQGSLREENTSVILRVLRSQPGVCRADIARICGLTPPTVSRLLEFLLDKGLVKEKKHKIDKIGRRPVGLYFNGGGYYIVGLSLARNELKGVLTDLNGKIVKEDKISINSKTFGGNDLSKVIGLIKTLIRRKGKKNIIGIGFASSGIVSVGDGIVVKVPRFPKFKDVPVKSFLEKKLLLKTIVANDASAEAVAEQYFGKGEGVSDFVLLHVGEGIGMGIVLNGELYSGNFGVSGEVGHISIDIKNGKKCECGNKGCIELYAGLNALLKEASALLKKKVQSIDDLTKLAGKRNRKLLKLLKERGELLGYAMIDVVNLLAPQKIIVTGELSTLYEEFLKPMKEIVDKYSFYGVGKEIPLELSEIKDNPMPFAAAAMVLREFLQNPYAFLP